MKFAPKFIWENKSPQKTKSSFKNTKKEALVLTDIKTNCTSRVIKLVWYWLKNKESNEGKKRAKTQKLNLQYRWHYKNQRAKDCLVNGTSSLYGGKNENPVSLVNTIH